MESVAYEALLERDGRVMTHVVGNSMKPLLHDRQSIVIVGDVRKVPPRKGDVVLYRTQDTYILHRVMDTDGSMYHIRGDNTWRMEHVPRQALLATMTGFYRSPRGRLITLRDPLYRLYCAALPLIRCVRKAGARVKQRLRRGAGSGKSAN